MKRYTKQNPEVTHRFWKGSGVVKCDNVSIDLLPAGFSRFWVVRNLRLVFQTSQKTLFTNLRKKLVLHLQQIYSRIFVTAF